MSPQFEAPLIHFLLRHCLMGIAAAFALAVTLVGLDTVCLGTLVFGSENPFLALAMGVFGLAIAFGGAAMGTAIFLLPGPDSDKDRGIGPSP